MDIQKDGNFAWFSFYRHYLNGLKNQCIYKYGLYKQTKKLQKFGFELPTKR